NLVPNQTFSVSSSSSTMIPSPISITTNASGVTDVYVQDGLPETATLTFTDATGTLSFGIPIQFVSASAKSIALTATPTSVAPDGVSFATVSALVRDANGVAVSNAVVDFYTLAGTAVISSSRVLTDISGNAIVTVRDTYAEIIDVYAELRLNGVNSVSTSITFEQTVASMSLIATPTVARADDGISTDVYSTVSATLLDATGSPLSGRSVVFTTTGNGKFTTTGLGSATVATNLTGVASVTLYDQTAETVSVVAKHGAFSQPATVKFTPGVKTLNVITVPNNGRIAADGVSSGKVIVNAKDSNGLPIQDVLISVYDIYGTSAQLNTGTALTNATGTVEFTVVDPVAETVRFFVTDGQFKDKYANFDFVSPQPAYVTLATNKYTLQSDNSDTAIITATVLTDTYSVVPNATVAFSSNGGGSVSGGVLSASSVITDANGQAFVTLRAGSSDASNKTITVSAAVSGLTAKQIPILVVGSKVNITSNISAFDVGTTTQMTVNVTDAGGNGVPYSTVNLSSASGFVEFRGAGTTAPAVTSLTANVTGQLIVDVYALAQGVETITASSLGTSATKSYDITNIGSVFNIAVPATDPYSITTGQALDVYVNAGALTDVLFSTSLGTWENGKATIQPTVVGTLAWATLTSTNAGMATIQVFDPNNLSTFDSTKVAVSAPVSDAYSLTIQANRNILALDTGAGGDSVILTALVTNPYGQPIGNAQVQYEIVNALGGGEFIQPSLNMTNASGKATTILTSGTVSSTQSGLQVKATVIQAGVPTAITGTVSVVIGGTAASVVIGRANSVVVLSPTEYQLPMSVLVTDSNGNPVQGTQVTLSAWPNDYVTGFWTGTLVSPPPTYIYSPTVIGTYPNEDLNENVTLDTGEDINGDGILTPPSAAAGSLPSTVTTDANGVGSFNLVYPKSSAVWVRDRIRARVMVQGTESTGSLIMTLPALKSDAEDGLLPDSPFANVSSMVATATPATLPQDTYTTVQVTVLDRLGSPLSGSAVNFSVTGSAVLTQSSVITDVTGVATVQVIDGTAETVTVLAKVGSFSTTATATFTQVVNTLKVSVIPSIAAIAADGVSLATVQATIKDAVGSPIAGKAIIFTDLYASSALLSIGSAITDATGTARITVSDTYAEAVTVLASADTYASPVAINFVSSIVKIVSSATPVSLLGDGATTSTLSIVITDQNGVPQLGRAVTLSTTGLAQLSAVSGTTDAFGSVKDAALNAITVKDTVAEPVVITVIDLISNTATTIPIQFVSNDAYTLAIAASPASGTTPDGVTPATLVASVRDVYGVAVANALVRFETTDSYATLANLEMLTGIDGRVLNNLTRTQAGTASISVSTPQNVAVAAKAIDVSFGQTPATVSIVPTATNVAADGVSTASLTITVRDALGQLISGQPVNVSSTGAAVLSLASFVTDATGTGTVTIKDATVQSVTVTATASGIVGTQAINFTQAVGAVDPYTVSFTNAIDNQGNSNANLSFDVYTAPTAADVYSTYASGLDTVQVKFRITDGANPIAGQAVIFSATGNQGGLPAIAPRTSTTDGSGFVTVTVTDTYAELVSIAASAGNMISTQNLNFIALAPAGIVLLSTNPAPATIGIASSGTQQSASLTFNVVDTNNNLVQGSHLIDFTILGGGLNGGETLQITQSSTINGAVTTVFNAGAKAGTVQIRASLNSNPSIFADVTVTITGGLPNGGSFGLSALPLNIEGRLTKGITQSITAFVSDFFSNPVAPNVQAQFQTDFASIGGTSVFTSNGVSSSALTTMTSAFPDPTDGFVTAAAQTIGGTHAKVLSVAVDPTNSNIIYAGTDGGGVFKTTDGGVNWTQVGTPLKTIGANKFANLTGSIIRDLKLDPNNPSVLYAATENGLFLSMNGAQDWQSLTGLRHIVGDNLGTMPATGSYLSNGLWSNDNVNISPYTFAYDHSGVRSRTKIFVNALATEGYILTTDQFGKSAVVFTGTPGGTSLQGAVITADYDTLPNIPSTVPYFAVAIDSSTYSVQRGYSGTIYVGTYGGGVWKTTDGGNTWIKASTMAAASVVPFGQNVTRLIIDSTGVNIFAGTDGSGLYQSNDSAVTWSKVTGATAATALNETVVQDVYTATIGVDPYVWVAGKNGIHLSRDGGLNWSVPTTNVNAVDNANTDVRAFAHSATALYAITNGDVLGNSTPKGGVYVSTNLGDTWTKLSDVYSAAGAHRLEAIQVTSGVTSATDIITVGTEGRTVYRSIDGGSTWSALNGTAPANMTNTLFTTKQVMHSGPLLIQVVPQSATYQPMNDYTYASPGYYTSGISKIYNGESHTFYIRVSDDLGNTVTSGTTLTVTVNAGTVTGNTAVTLRDGVYGKTDYAVTWSNDLTTVTPTDILGTMSIGVTSNNGTGQLSVARTLVNPLNVTSNTTVTDSYTNVAGTPMPVSVSGGSNSANGFTFTSQVGCPTTAAGCVLPTVITVPAGASATTFYYFSTDVTKPNTVNDTISALDLATGKTLSIPITVTYQ
ncbi:MAG: hypothetical protein COS35_03675, partial [Zetaproteobacteria bacterium CG02_land_8_20_14_3_00_50_9]